MLRLHYRSLSVKLLFIMLIAVALPVFGDDAAEKEAWEKYAYALELLIDKNTDEALVVMKELISDYPDTAAAEKAEKYVANYIVQFDRSGIISFYLGTMMTTTWAATSIPLILEIENGIVMGTAGLIGVGSGIYTSCLMSKNIDMSLGKDLWIEFIEAAAMTNFQYAYSIFGDRIADSAVREKINIGAQTFTSLASRGLTYKYVINKNPSEGRAFTVINTYAWSQYYYWVAMSEIFNSKNENLNYTLGILVPDLAAFTSYHLWEKAGWSVQRAGIISISGLGGLLAGVFINMIIAEAGNTDPPDSVTSSIILGSSLSGKIIGAYASSNMKPDGKADSSLSDFFCIQISS